jgi:citronellol/citronellal dehydrogenase
MTSIPPASGPPTSGQSSYRSIFRPNLFASKVTIVTGGGSGIGRCTAHELASLGARLALVGRKADKLEKVKAEIADTCGGEARCFPCDIRNETEVEATLRRVIETFGRIDHLVNNAGGQYVSPLESISQKGWEAVVRTNLTGGFLMARASYVQWMSKHGGAIVNVVADMWRGMPGMAHSGAARAGMVNFTETAALEWAPANVRVNAVAPGWIASSGFDHYPAEMGDYLRSLAGHVPLGRFGTEAEVSAAIVFLLSEAAAFITGATLRIDGGVPNTHPNWPLPERKASAPVFDGFPLAEIPKVLRGKTQD